jgi:hypothetical protein
MKTPNMDLVPSLDLFISIPSYLLSIPSKREAFSLRASGSGCQLAVIAKLTYIFSVELNHDLLLIFTKRIVKGEENQLVELGTRCAQGNLQQC